MGYIAMMGNTYGILQADAYDRWRVLSMSIIIDLENSFMRFPFRLIWLKRLSQLRPQHQFRSTTKEGDWIMQVENRSVKPLPKEGSQKHLFSVDTQQKIAAKEKMISSMNMSSYMVEGTGLGDDDSIGIADVKIKTGDDDDGCIGEVEINLLSKKTDIDADEIVAWKDDDGHQN